MVDGKLKCLGTSQRLKHKFGASYEINIRCPEELRAKCIQKLQVDFGSGKVEEEHRTYFRLKVDHDVDLSAAFGTLEALKAKQEISEYSMSQSTLEQIFINFAKQQNSGENRK
jgi:ATP-binding cassette subfamily A (ABC1) protein 5